MKIGISDSCALKFSKDIKEWWEKDHEVRYEIGGSEFIAQWADIYFIDWVDNNIHYLWKWYKEHPDAKKPKFYVRAIDWDVWVRGIRSQEMVDFVDGIICIAPHIQKWLLKEKDDSTGVPIQWNNKLHLIYPAVNLERFPLKTKVTDGYQLGMVLGDMWWYKNHMAGLDIFTSLYKKNNKWRFHIRGNHEAGQYNPVMFMHYLESRGIKDVVFLQGHYNDMNEFYEQIDILLHPGMKESFCYAVAEAMAKGIQPILNNFYGSESIWPERYVYTTHEEAIQKITVAHSWVNFPQKIQEVRKYVEEKYSLERMMKELNQIMGI